MPLAPFFRILQPLRAMPLSPRSTTATMTKKALILGISGQDGAYLAKLLLSKGYEVHGTSRDAEAHPFTGLAALGIRDQVKTHSVSLMDFRNLLQVVAQVEPDEIYNLAGQSSVGLSFSQPVMSFESIATGTLQALEVIRFLKAPIRFYTASSSECFGDVPVGSKSSEANLFAPRSPYAMAKAAAFWATANYREGYGLYACSGILFNHESPLRPARYVTQKIVSAAARIARGDKIKLELGNLDIWRDWGYAPEYVEAMWLMLQQDKPSDFVIASGETHSLRDFLEHAFSLLELNWQDHVTINKSLFRPSDLAYSGADISKAKARLNWQVNTRFKELVELLFKTACEATS